MKAVARFLGEDQWRVDGSFVRPLFFLLLFHNLSFTYTYVLLRLQYLTVRVTFKGGHSKTIYTCREGRDIEVFQAATVLIKSLLEDPLDARASTVESSTKWHQS